MSFRRRRRRQRPPTQLLVAGVVAAAALCLPTPADAATDAVTLRGSAGLGGLTKPGRWAPVLVDVETGGSLASGELVISWGDAEVRRRIPAATAGLRRFEIYIRAADPTGAMRVHLTAAPASALDLPVTVLSHQESVTLCIAAPDDWLADGASCSVTLPPDRLPRSVRGWEIVDHVVSANDTRTLGEERRRLLDQWAALRRMDASGDLSLTPQVTRPMLRRGLPASSAGAVAVVAAAYAALLLLIGLMAVRWHAGVARPALAVLVLIVAAGAASSAIGRVGSSARVRVHHASQLQQLAGAPGALLALRGVAEFPADAAFDVALAVPDAMIEPAAASGRAPQRSDEGGFPLLTGRFGLGARQAFSAEAIFPADVVEVAGDHSIRVTNRTSETLQDCRFADGMSPQTIGSLAPGATATAERIADVVGPLLTCTLAQLPVTFMSGTRAVDLRGATQVVVYRQRPTAAPSTDEN